MSSVCSSGPGNSPAVQRVRYRSQPPTADFGSPSVCSPGWSTNELPSAYVTTAQRSTRRVVTLTRAGIERASLATRVRRPAPARHAHRRSRAPASRPRPPSRRHGSTRPCRPRSLRPPNRRDWRPRSPPWPDRMLAARRSPVAHLERLAAAGGETPGASSDGEQPIDLIPSYASWA
jgi:hypothetical protein